MFTGISLYSSITPPYLVFSTGDVIKRVKPDGTDYDTLVPTKDGSGAISVVYHLG